jgi:hypothetical protein
VHILHDRAALYDELTYRLCSWPRLLSGHGTHHDYGDKNHSVFVPYDGAEKRSRYVSMETLQRRQRSGDRIAVAAPQTQ